MNVIHTIASLDSASGGLARAVVQLCDALGALGESVEVVARQSRLPGGDVGRGRHVGTTLVPSPWFGRILAERSNKTGVQLIHDNGIWLATNHSTAVFAEKSGIPLVISPHGMLESWALRHKAWKKRLAWFVYQGRDIRRARVLHATSAMELESLRRLGLEQPIALIPNGVEIPFLAEAASGKQGGWRTVLFLGRIHPIKGLLNLVKAWSMVRPKNWRVVVAGPDEGGYQAEVEAAVRAAGLKAVFSFIGPVNDEKKWDVYRQADLFVLPSFSENFGLVVAEALACGVPVITTKGAPWEDLRIHHCGWWVDVGPQPLAEAIAEATLLGDESRRDMGANGRRLVEREFAWPKIAAQMLGVYRWAVDGGAPPDCVRLAA